MQQCLQISFILNLKARRTHRPSKQSAQEQERERENIITLKKKKKKKSPIILFEASVSIMKPTNKHA